MARKKRGTNTTGADGVQVILRNRRARHDYEILDEFEAGMVLQGSEVKSLRDGDVQWGDAHARLDHRRELWLYGLHIGEYRHAVHTGHEAQARRKLLMHGAQLDKLAGAMQGKGLSMVPTALLFRRGWAKCVLAVVRGRKKADKRKHMLDEARKRDVQRELARRMRG